MFKEAWINMAHMARELWVKPQTVKEWNDWERPIPKWRINKILSYIWEQRYKLARLYLDLDEYKRVK